MATLQFRIFYPLNQPHDDHEFPLLRLPLVLRDQTTCCRRRGAAWRNIGKRIAPFAGPVLVEQVVFLCQREVTARPRNPVE